MIQMTTLQRFICIVLYVLIQISLTLKIDGHIGFISHISCIFVACSSESEFADMFTPICLLHPPLLVGRATLQNESYVTAAPAVALGVGKATFAVSTVSDRSSSGVSSAVAFMRKSHVRVFLLLQIGTLLCIRTVKAVVASETGERKERGTS